MLQTRRSVVAATIPIISTLTALFHGIIPPRIGGFYCHDSKIDQEFTQDTFPTKWLLILSLLPILGVMFDTERDLLTQNISKEEDGDKNKNVNARAWSRAKGLYGIYFVSTATTLLVNEILKSLLPEPRPHFFQSCRPDWEHIDCTSSDGFVVFNESLCLNANEPVANNPSPKPITDSMKSFPSGHAQLSVFACAFALAYFNLRTAQLRNSFHLKHAAVQFIYVMFALSASLTRISDNRHHWWDVLIGSILGLISSYASVKFGCNSFREDFIRSLER